MPTSATVKPTTIAINDSPTRTEERLVARSSIRCTNVQAPTHAFAAATTTATATQPAAACKAIVFFARALADVAVAGN